MGHQSVQGLNLVGAFAVRTWPISLGASFWFDLYNRLIYIRYGMRRPEVETG